MDPQKVLVAMFDEAPSHPLVLGWIEAKWGGNGLAALRAMRDVLVSADTATLNALRAAYAREGGT